MIACDMRSSTTDWHTRHQYSGLPITKAALFTMRVAISCCNGLPRIIPLSGSIQGKGTGGITMIVSQKVLVTRWTTDPLHLLRTCDERLLFYCRL